MSRVFGQSMRSRATAPRRAAREARELADFEAVLGPAAEWAGRCHEVSSACVARGLVRGVAVYGHWLGEVAPGSYFGQRRPGLPFVRHGWVRRTDGKICDPTRWAFTGEAPHVFVGPNGGEYDEGGNVLRAALLREPPRFDPMADRIYHLAKDRLSAEAWEHIERLLGAAYLGDLTECDQPGDLTREQMFWLANLPLGSLGQHAREIYEAIAAEGEEAFVPVDNRLRAEREGGGG